MTMSGGEKIGELTEVLFKTLSQIKETIVSGTNHEN